jgi:CRP/FNR family transcriptional regulator, cyclic AMP receptor protein
MPMPLIPNIAIFQRKLAGFPIATYRAGQTVLTAASTTGRLLILKKGAVAVLKEGVEIATVTEPGAMLASLHGWRPCRSAAGAWPPTVS